MQAPAIIKRFFRCLYIPFILASLLLSGCKEEAAGLEPDPKQSKDPLPYRISENKAIQYPADISIDSINSIALEEWGAGNYQNAFDHISMAYKMARKDDNPKQLALVLNTLGLIHWRLENSTDAMACYEEAAKLAEKEQQERLLGLTHTNRALIHKQNDSFDLAFLHNNKAINIFSKNELHRDLAIALNNQGQIFKNQNSNDSAKEYYQKALKNYHKVKYADGAAATYYNLSEIYSREGLTDSSMLAAKQSLKLALESESKVRISEAYNRLAEVYETRNQADSALRYLKLHHLHNTDMLIANQSNKLAHYQAAMGTEVKNLRIQNLEKEKELASNRLWFIGIWIFIGFLIAGFFVSRYVSRVRLKKRELEVALKNSKKILQIKEHELKNYILDLSEKNATISKLQQNITKETPDIKLDTQIAQLLEQKILTEDDWEIFKTKFNAIYPGFFTRIKQFTTPLTEAEIRFMVLLRLELSGKDMAKILGISPQSVRVCKMRLKKKLQKEGFQTVEDFLHALIL